MPRARRRSVTVAESTGGAVAGRAARAGSEVLATTRSKCSCARSSRVSQASARSAGRRRRDDAQWLCSTPSSAKSASSPSASPLFTRLLPLPRPPAARRSSRWRGRSESDSEPMWNRSLMPTPSSLVWRPSVAMQADGVARARVLGLERLQRRDDEQALVARAGEVAVAERVAVTRELQRLLAVEVRGTGGKCAPEKSSSIGAGMLTSMPPISSTICWKCGKFARMTQVIGTPTIDYTASASSRRSLPPGLFTMYELILLPPGPSVSRGMSRMRRRLHRRVHADHVHRVGEAGVVGRLRRVVGAGAGAEHERRRRAAAGRRRCGRRRASSPGTTPRPAPGTGAPSATQAAVTVHRRGAARTAAGATTSRVRAAPADGRVRGRGGAGSGAHFVAPVVATAVVVVGERPAPSRVTTTL